MIDIKLNDDGSPNWAFLRNTELKAGKTLIHLGGNMDKLNSEVRNDFDEYVFPVHLHDKIAKSNMPATTLFHEDLEAMITHESCHIAIYKLTGSIQITQGLDRLEDMEMDAGRSDILAVCDER